MKKIIENLSREIKTFRFYDAKASYSAGLFHKKNLLRMAGLVLVLSFFLFIPFGSDGLNIAHAGWFGDITGGAIKGILDIVGFTAGAVAEIAFQVLSWLLEFVWMPILSWVLVVVGNLFDQVITFSLSTSIISSLQGIKDGWAIVRDLINLSFIFLLLYIAINTMLGTSGSADKKILANLVIAAIFINFSYYITGLIIDAGNIVALAFRGAIKAGSGGTGGLGTMIMNAIKVSELYAPSGFGSTALLSVGIRTFVMGLSIYAIGAATLLFIVRIITFIILLILSPIGFVGNLSPKFAEQSKKWWNSLIGQTLVAPVFLFFFYVIARLVENNNFFNVISSNSPTSGAEIGMSYYFNFVIIIGLLLTAVKLSKQFSGELGGKVVGFAGSLGKIGVGLLGAGTLSGLAMAGRASLGRGASMMLAKTEKGLLGAKSEGGIKGFGANLALKSLKKTESGSFDVRSTGVGKTGLGLVKGVKFGKAGGKGGFKKSFEKTVEKQRGDVKDMTDEQKRSYAKNVLQKPIWAGGQRVDPNSLLGKMSKKVQAGEIIKKEAGLKINKKVTDDEIKNLNEEIKRDSDTLNQVKNRKTEWATKQGEMLDLKEKIEANERKIKDSKERLKTIKKEIEDATGKYEKKEKTEELKDIIRDIAGDKKEDKWDKEDKEE
ncbi:MAG: hypothetical protein WC849_02100 [Candidatus Paceibacterota bacterium]